MVDNGIWTSHLKLANRGDTRHMFYARHQRLCGLVNSARHGPFQDDKKNAEYWIEYFPFEKLFRLKLIKQIKFKITHAESLVNKK